jgi:hypothetical protein
MASGCHVLAADAVLLHASGQNPNLAVEKANRISIGGGISELLHIRRHFSFLVSGFGRITTDRARFLVGNVTGMDQAYRVPLGTLDASIANEWIF